MVTTVLKTIGSGGDFANEQAWFDASPADLTTANGGTIWKGRWLPGYTRSGTGTLLTMSNRTVSATCYFDLGVQAGGSIYDTAANPLHLDKAKGVTLEASGPSMHCIYNTLPYTRIDGVQLLGSDTTSNAAAVLRNSAANCTFTRLLCDGVANNSALDGLIYITGGNCVVANVNVAQKTSVTTAVIAYIDSTATVVNCNFVSLNATLQKGVRTAYGQSTFKNCYIGGVTAPLDDLSGSAGYPSYAYNCATSAAAWPTLAGGSGNLANVALSAANFVNVTAAAYDLKTVTGSALLDKGALDATNAPTDAYGTVRPQGGAADIGVYEYPAAADTTAPILSAPTASASSVSNYSGSVSTNEAGGTLYYLIQPAASAAPSVATMVASGSARGVPSTGALAVSGSGLSQNTAYKLHFMQKDDAGNASAVVSSASFTTPAADAVAPTFPNGAVITPGAITSSSLAFSYPAASDNVAVVGYDISKDSGASWVDNGTGTNGSFPGLAANTTYPIWVRARDAAGNFSTQLQTSMTTSTPATGSFKTLPLANNTGTLYAAGTSISWQWHQGGRVGTAATGVTYGNGTLSADGTLTCAGLPLGSGYLLAAILGANMSADKPYYQSGTVT